MEFIVRIKKWLVVRYIYMSVSIREDMCSDRVVYKYIYS